MERENENNRNKANVERVVLETVGYLRCFIPPAQMRNFKIGMRDLVLEVMTLHTVMMRSKAIFIVQWIGNGDGENLCTYDPATMESAHDVDADSSYYLAELVEVPALVKVGNADGENLNSSTIACKSSVRLRMKEAV